MSYSSKRTRLLLKSYKQSSSLLLMTYWSVLGTYKGVHESQMSNSSKDTRLHYKLSKQSSSLVVVCYWFVLVTYKGVHETRMMKLLAPLGWMKFCRMQGARMRRVRGYQIVCVCMDIDIQTYTDIYM